MLCYSRPLWPDKVHFLIEHVCVKPLYCLKHLVTVLFRCTLRLRHQGECKRVFIVVLLHALKVKEVFFLLFIVILTTDEIEA